MIKTSILPLAFIGLITATTIPTIASETYGNPFEGSGFIKDDWQVVCDNTLTCRAAGYVSNYDFGRSASIMFVAKANVALPEAYVTFIDEEKDANADGIENDDEVAELWLNNKNYGEIHHEYHLYSKQTQTLLDHAHKNIKIEIKTANNSWQVSDKGMLAVLLKLDDIQGRIGTPIALVSKNNPNRQIPIKANLKPLINKAFAYAEPYKKQLNPDTLAYYQKNILNWVQSESRKLSSSKDQLEDCYLINTENEANPERSFFLINTAGWEFIPIDDNHTLASHLCWQGAYNEGQGYWLLNHSNPEKPQLITISGHYQGDGEISANHRGRGLGDCWSITKWVWNGETFAISQEMTTGLCRGVLGGAWELPTYVSEVIKP